MSTTEVARLLGVSEVQLQDRVRRGLIPEPLRVGGTRVWLEQDIAAAGAFFADQAEPAAPEQGAAADG